SPLRGADGHTRVSTDHPRHQLREILRHLRATESWVRLHKNSGDAHLRARVVLRGSVY
ncbi:hypothetical protein O3G_MSEX000465, partial [Manduca sexta]